MAEDQDELDGMPEPSARVYLSGSVGAPEGFLDGITKAQIGKERRFAATVEIKEVGDQKQRSGRGHFVRFALVDLISLDK